MQLILTYYYGIQSFITLFSNILYTETAKYFPQPHKHFFMLYFNIILEIYAYPLSRERKEH
jgi:hypothetical protein